MSLATAVEIELRNAGFTGDFEEQRDLWKDMARVAYDYTCKTVEGDPKQDDVSPHLALALQTRSEFLDIKDRKKLTAKKWFAHFADLIIARTWNELPGGGTNA